MCVKSEDACLCECVQLCGLLQCCAVDFFFSSLSFEGHKSPLLATTHRAVITAPFHTQTQQGQASWVAWTDVLINWSSMETDDNTLPVCAVLMCSLSCMSVC